MAGAAPKTVGPLVDRPGAVRYSNLEYQLLKLSGQAIGDFGLIRAGDRILVAVSGGPSSVALCALLEHHRRRFDFRFELVPLHLEEAGPPPGLADLLGRWGLKLLFEPHRPPSPAERGSPAASACRRRLWALYRAAARLGCPKIADGRLLDDFLEQFILNLEQQARLGAMPVKATGRDYITLIRPLVYVERHQAAHYCRQLGWPGGHPGQIEDAALEEARRQLADLGRQNARLKISMLSALRNVRVTHLLDRRFQDRPDCSYPQDGSPA